MELLLYILCRGAWDQAILDAEERMANAQWFTIRPFTFHPATQEEKEALFREIYPMLINPNTARRS